MTKKQAIKVLKDHNEGLLLFDSRWDRHTIKEAMEACFRLLSKPAKRKQIECDGRKFTSPIDAMIHVLWLIQRLCEFKPKEQIGKPCDGFRFRECIVAARKLLTELGIDIANSGKLKKPAKRRAKRSTLTGLGWRQKK